MPRRGLHKARKSANRDGPSRRPRLGPRTHRPRFDSPAPAPAPVVQARAPAARHEPAAPAAEVPPSASDPVAARAEVFKRIEKLEKSGAGDPRAKPALPRRCARPSTSGSPAGRAGEGDRERAASEHPDPDPKVVAEQARADFERTQSMLDQSAKQPDALLPEAFRTPAAKVDDAALAAMKEAIDAATSEIGELASRAETLRPDPGETDRRGPGGPGQGPSAPGRPGRPPRRAARRALVGVDRGPRAGGIRLENLVWEDRAEAERVAELDARIALEARRVDCDAVALKAAEARRDLARRTLDRMRGRFQVLAERKRSDLQRAANAAQSEAGRSGDKLEQYKARRTAELLRLQARIVTEEKSLTADTGPSADEQKRLADRAVKDRDAIKKIVEEGRGGGLVALRLKNDYRRIMAERDLVADGVLPKAEEQLTLNENLLTEAELVLLNDSRDDRVELDSLLESLPRARHDDARRAFETIEARHRELLTKRCDILTKLVDRDEDARLRDPPADRRPGRAIRVHPHPPVLGPRRRADRPLDPGPGPRRRAASRLGPAATRAGAGRPPALGGGSPGNSSWRRRSP